MCDICDTCNEFDTIEKCVDEKVKNSTYNLDELLEAYNTLKSWGMTSKTQCSEVKNFSLCQKDVPLEGDYDVVMSDVEELEKMERIRQEALLKKKKDELIKHEQKHLELIQHLLDLDRLAEAQASKVPVQSPDRLPTFPLPSVYPKERRSQRSPTRETQYFRRPSRSPPRVPRTFRRPSRSPVKR